MNQHIRMTAVFQSSSRFAVTLKTGIMVLFVLSIFNQRLLSQNHRSIETQKPRADKQDELKRFEVSYPLMGVKFKFAIYAANVDLAQQGLVAAVKRIQKLENCMSDYDPESELSELGRRAKSGAPIKVSDDLFDILQLSEQIWKTSQGSFDPTVGPLSKLWRKARRAKKFPDKEQVEECRKSVGWENVVLDSVDKTVAFKKDGMELDLGGIAKGYAADEAIRIFKKMGLPRCMVDAGGDVTVGDAPPNKKGWTIAIANSDGKKLSLSNASVATSGDRFQFLENNGQRYSHIIDPKTGWGMTDRRLVTVVSTGRKQTGAWADGWASALSVIPADRLKKELGDKIKVGGIQILRIKPKDAETVFESGVLRSAD